MGKGGEKSNGARGRGGLGCLAALLVCLLAALWACTSGLGLGTTPSWLRQTSGPLEVRAQASDEDATWGCTLVATVANRPHGSEVLLDWQFSTDGGTTWVSYGSAYAEGRVRRLETVREWTGTLWRCVATVQDEGGGTTQKAVSDVLGPIGPQKAKAAGTLHHPKPMRVGQTLRFEPRVPEDVTVLVRWLRAPTFDGEYTYIDGAVGLEYTLTTDDLGGYIACQVDAAGYGYEFDSDKIAVSLPVLAADGAGSGADLGAAAVYICDDAEESWYHTYDCDYLSGFRQQGYSTREVSLAEAKTYCSACPYCGPAG